MALAPYPVVHGGAEEVVLNFRFQINSTSDPDNVVQSNGIVSDIVRDAAGDFEITLDSSFRYSTMINGFAAVQNDASHTAQVISYTSSTGVVVVETHAQDGTPAAADPADDTWVHVQLVLCRRSAMAPTTAI